VGFDFHFGAFLEATWGVIWIDWPWYLHLFYVFVCNSTRKNQRDCRNKKRQIERMIRWKKNHDGSYRQGLTPAAIRSSTVSTGYVIPIIRWFGQMYNNKIIIKTFLKYYLA